MKKIDEVYEYLNKNLSKEKSQLLRNMVKKFSISDRTAELYYYRWKKEYMKTSKCIPKEVAKKMNNSKGVDRTMREDINIKSDAKKVADEVERQVEKEIKKDHIAEVSKKVDDLEVLEEVVIKEVKLKGKNGVYQAKTGLGVALENGEYKLAFSSVEEVEEFCNEFKKVFERI